MKIGILTFHRAINYGAVMQAYSLVEKLRKELPSADIEIVDYNCSAREFYKIKCPLVFLYRRTMKEAIQKAVQTRIFNKFIKRLPLSKAFLWERKNAAEKYISKNYDVLIVGSDAVFNWNDLGLPNIYFADKIKVPYKFTYAASAHLQKYEKVCEKEKEYLYKALDSFDYVGVRDCSSERFVSFFCEGKQTYHNCDPTVFLDMGFPEDSLRKKLAKHNFDFSKKTIFVMLMRPEIASMVKRKFGDEYQIVALMDSNAYADCYLFDLNPFEWAHVFSYGSFVVTDYFHATMLSLKNGTPVMSVDGSGYCKAGYESKAYDLLHTRLNLPHLYVDIEEIKGENGYNNFCKRADVILAAFDADVVKEKLLAEAQSCLSFFEKLKNLKGLD